MIVRRYLAGIVLCLLSVSASAELVIEITQGRDNAMPVAIVPFGTDLPEPPPVDVAAIVSADLHRSGQFKPVASKDMLAHPSRAEDVVFRDWRQIKVEYLVIGRVSEAPVEGALKVDYALYDVNRGVRLMAESYQPRASQLRDVAHKISDRIFEQLTGLPGAFSTRILYVTVDRSPEQPYPYQLQYADADGARAQTILRSREPIMSPAWSPDGKKVAYVSFEANGLPGIYIHELATAKKTKVSSFSGINGAPAWSPDGRQLALTLSRDGNPEIYLLELETGALRRMTNHYAIDTEPRWMPDGESILFTSGRTGGPQIYQMMIADGTINRLTFEGSYNARADITPDGRHLVFVHRRQGRFHIAVQDLVRGTFDVVTRTDLDESPSIAPNGIMIIYATQVNGEGVLEAVSIDGRVKVHLPSKEGHVREPAWSPYLN